MHLLFLAFCCLVALANSQRVPSNYRLCVSSRRESQKCQDLVNDARRNLFNLRVTCVTKRNLTDCIEDVRRGRSELVVVEGLGYRRARNAGLKPLVYARERKSNYYVAIAPANISYADVFNAQIEVNTKDDHAMHAAVLFNLFRGRDICPDVVYVKTPTIRIQNSNAYVNVSVTENILICPSKGYANVTNPSNCNFDVTLQRALFGRDRLPVAWNNDVRQVFKNILDTFKKDTPYFDFWAPYNRVSDVIFKDNTTAFDTTPYIYNGITEESFNNLHCNLTDIDHKLQLGEDYTERTP